MGGIEPVGRSTGSSRRKSRLPSGQALEIVVVEMDKRAVEIGCVAPLKGLAVQTARSCREPAGFRYAMQAVTERSVMRVVCDFIGEIPGRDTALCRGSSEAGRLDLAVLAAAHDQRFCFVAGGGPVIGLALYGGRSVVTRHLGEAV